MRFNVHLHLEKPPRMSVNSFDGHWWIDLGDSPSNAMGVFCAGVSMEQAQRAVEAFNRALFDEQPASLTIEVFPLNAAE